MVADIFAITVLAFLRVKWHCSYFIPLPVIVTGVWHEHYGEQNSCPNVTIIYVFLFEQLDSFLVFKLLTKKFYAFRNVFCYYPPPHLSPTRTPIDILMRIKDKLEPDDRKFQCDVKKFLEQFRILKVWKFASHHCPMEIE